MPTTQTRYVDPDSTAGGDGTTNALSGANRAYVSLNAWEAAEQANLVTFDRIAEVICDSNGGPHTADTTSVTLTGWTTDSTRYISIHSPASYRSGSELSFGQYNTARYRLERTNAIILDPREEFIRISGIQFKFIRNDSDTFQSAVIDCGSLPASSTIQITDCVFFGAISGADTNGAAIKCTGPDCIYKISNNIIYDFVNSTTVCVGISLSATGTTAYVYNNTVFNCRTGYNRAAGTFVAKNNIAQDCNDGFAGTFDGASTNNCSDIASDAPGSNPVTGTVSFQDEVNDDFHLAAGDTVAKNAGTDLSGDSNFPFSDDIDGFTRSVVWDIGADESQVEPEVSLKFIPPNKLRQAIFKPGHAR